jgi:hypothetical protein
VVGGMVPFVVGLKRESVSESSLVTEGGYRYTVNFIIPRTDMCQVPVRVESTSV